MYLNGNRRENYAVKIEFSVETNTLLSDIAIIIRSFYFDRTILTYIIIYYNIGTAGRGSI